MTLWIWIVIAMVVGLVIYELISWIRRKARPATEEATEDVEAIEAAQAELARANMKIAVLQSRLEEAEIRHEDEQAALAVQHKQQLAKTEAAYQRQMITLSERLAKNGKGDWRVAAEREKAQKQAGSDKFPVRMAAEVAAWKATTFGEEPGVDTAVSKDGTTSTKDNDMSIDLPDPAVNTPSAETADPNSDNPAVSNVAATRNGVAAAVAAISGLDLAEIEATIEDEYGRMDDAPQEQWVLVSEQYDLEDSSPETVSGESPPERIAPAVDADEWLPDQDQEVLERITVLDEEPTAAADLRQETAEPDDEQDTLENHRPRLEDEAMQRVLARRLGSEMDADYLDDDEFLKEMGIEQPAPDAYASSGAAAEDIMGAENWITDPLEEMANHLSGDPDPWTADPDSAAINGDEAPAPSIEVSDQAWEEMIYAEASAAREHGVDALDLDGAEDSAPPMQDPETGEFAVEMAGEQPLLLPPDRGAQDEDAVIAQTVAAILSRAPDGQDGQKAPAGSVTFAQRRTAAAGAQNEIPQSDGHLDQELLAGAPEGGPAAVQVAATPTNGSKKISPLRPFIWQREPIQWEAEYYDNIKLADKPAVVRQDNDIDFEWRGMAPAQGIEPRAFSVRWSGFLSLEPGEYRFTASAPDGLRLWLNDRLVISAWYDQSEQTYQRDFFWQGGSIDVRVEHYENGGNAKAFLTWDRVA